MSLTPFALHLTYRRGAGELERPARLPAREAHLLHTTLGGGLKFLEGVPMSLSGGREVRMDPKSIVRVVSVVDTRQVEEIGDRFVRVPGTGEENECARCGRLHEIHAAVETADGQLHVVGVSCARGSSIEDTVRKAIGRVRTIGRQRAEVASLAARMAEAEASLEELKRRGRRSRTPR